jgi:hypothetical protein
MSETMKALRKSALRHPGAQEGVSCEGTPAEKSTVKARGKAFLFLGVADAMFKLRESLAEAAELASKEPGRYKVGAHGWVKVTFSDGPSPPLEVLEKWIGESYRLVVGKQGAATLPGGALPASTKEAAKKTTAKKKAPAARRPRRA